MSVISFDDSYVGATSVSGEGAVTYTCPSNKRAEVIVTMILSYISIDFFNGTFAYDTKNYTFKLHLNPNDVLVFSQSGNGATSSIINIGCSFTKNTITQESKTLQVSNVPARYSAKISYSAKEVLN